MHNLLDMLLFLLDNVTDGKLGARRLVLLVALSALALPVTIGLLTAPEKLFGMPASSADKLAAALFLCGSIVPMVIGVVLIEKWLNRRYRDE